MRTLIVYGTKYDFTRGCVDEIVKRIDSKDVDVVNISDKADVDINRFDRVIIGSSIYMGMVNKNVKKFCQDNKDTLLKKTLGIFIICSATGDTAMDQITNNFDVDLLSHARAKDYLGGSVDLDRVSFFHRLIVKAVSKKSDEAVKRNNSILHDRIDSFVKLCS